MLELTGKYNTAKVFTDNVDSETISQVIQLMNMPYMEGCQTRIMPDCHAGAGCVVGTTIQLKDKVVLSFEDFKKSMQGIYSTSVVESTIDEAPAVYKPMEEIVKNIQDTVDIVDNIKPVYNFKAH